MNEAVDAKNIVARARMVELSRKFQKRCMVDLDLMRMALEQFAAGGSSSLGEMQHLAHRISGTAPTLGFKVLGDLAADLDTFLDSLPAGTPPDAISVARIRAQLDALAAELVNGNHTLDVLITFA